MKIFSLILPFFLLYSCQTTIIHFEQSQGIPAKEPEFTQVYGSVGLGILEVSKPRELPCARSPATVILTRRFVDVLVHIFVGGIWAPYRIELYCQ
ncbi:MAG: hypothetical protein HS115_06205 [Spirochaetales bacterium]|nr:hypothetical protein [Spirochaetales bacterium]